jgi:hypothetical protein
MGTLAVAAVSAACANKQPEVTPDDTPRVIGVGVSEMSTRNYVENADQILSLGIFGYSTGGESFDPDSATSTHEPNLFKNVEATRADADPATQWVYNPVAVWPTDDTANNTFFAYAPYMETGTEIGTEGYDGYLEAVATTGAPVIKYRVPKNISEQVDLLYSEYVTATDDDGNPTSWNPKVADIDANTNSGKVLYDMKHALLWMRFRIATEKMVLTPTQNTETYTITEFRFVGGHIVDAAKFDLGTGKWELDPEFAGTDDGYSDVMYEFDFLLNGNYRTIEAGKSERLGAALYGNHSYLMLIPDDFKYGTHHTSVEVSYTHNNGSDTSVDEEYFVTLPFPDVEASKPGYMYTYIVTISTAGAYIQFQESSTIEKWLEDESQRGIEVF